MESGTAAKRLLHDKRAELAGLKRLGVPKQGDRGWVFARTLRLQREIAELEASIKAAEERQS